MRLMSSPPPTCDRSHGFPWTPSITMADGLTGAVCTLVASKNHPVRISRHNKHLHADLIDTAEVMIRTVTTVSTRRSKTHARSRMIGRYFFSSLTWCQCSSTCSALRECPITGEAATAPQS